MIETILCCVLIWFSGFTSHKLWVENKAMRLEERELQQNIWDLERELRDNSSQIENDR